MDSFCELSKATGPIPYGLTNDCMFHFVFQDNIVALKGLLCSILHMDPSEIKELEVCNPIELGQSYDSKNFILDLKVRFNNDNIANFEMQVLNKGNWPERSLSYLCRSFDNLNKGMDYANVKSAVHIGFIDFDLFKDEPEFCGTYMMSNIKTHRIYSSKISLKVVELNHIELATDEDKQYRIDQWARLFKSTTWEELKMCAGNDDAMNAVAKMVYVYNEEEYMRDVCRAREEAVAYEEYMKREKERFEAEIVKMKEELQESEEKLQDKDAEIAKLKAELEKYKKNEN